MTSKGKKKEFVASFRKTTATTSVRLIIGEYHIIFTSDSVVIAPPEEDVPEEGIAIVEGPGFYKELIDAFEDFIVEINLP